ncbi:MAG: hypothetical protein CVV35_07375 [Methanomicrobiales archaeon HGW-Methanomicrobiales-6]|jgi:hypothetical protein|nr:MAG: hypothetical protein CVV35_07375 [Methanomicrobiales archaeon HGW-Methanomicrobiales-6]
MRTNVKWQCLRYDLSKYPIMSNGETDTYGYKGWLISDSFLKRAFAVFGYNLVAGLIIWLGLLIIFMLFAMVAAFVFGMASVY